MKTLATSLIAVFTLFAPLYGQKSSDYQEMPSNYFVGNSSYSLHQGQAYYANTWLFFNDFYYGVTDHISVGAGMMPLFLLDGAPTPVWLKAKVAYPIKKNMFNISAGMIGAKILDDEISTYSLSFFGGFTVGGPRTNLSLNYYYSGIGDKNSESFFMDNEHMIVISGRIGITPRSFILSDNFFTINETGSLHLIGFQTLFHGLILDYGLLIPLNPDMDAFYGFPYLGVKIPIGKNW